ncbi:MAG: cystathionine beta-synthase [Acidimicrobiaceae bacterium]|nr:cystathionine beta-synthase [Acidimicrobiaceae bacterium]MXZ98632.1 cystathionine beta-synthase [Acidimicrobiaceae bacterium]MYE98278.1 cystathionine beta-synthase [Acidimicrobiaceae bacterium]MYI53082.1 cystathionine beta-synthase [Acidimicrobiaceae bacterium]MYJ80881.1 cystathionine beta-synthase [Acidimicrobiaceae bacterium]
MEVADSVLDLVGNTPLVRMRRAIPEAGCDVLAKLEMLNPGGSVKDRIAIAMIDGAERDGLLKPGGTIIEPTSGNTGVGLAMVGAQRGYRCVFVMTDKVSPEKVQLLRAYGAEVVVCPVAVAPEDPDSYYSTAERLMASTPGAYQPNQYFNQENPRAHEKTTGPELWRQTEGRITHFVAGPGTGGTISGVGRYLKRKNPSVQIIAADPEGSVFSGGSGRPYLVEGIGEDFWPETYHPDVVDRVIAVSDQASFDMARLVSHREGLLIGGSGGTAVCAAVEAARDCGPDDVVVLLLPDSGRGYLSKVFNDGWMASHGFLIGEHPCVKDVLDAKEGALPPLVYVNPDEPVSLAVTHMRDNGLSQLPVAKGEMPLAAAEVMGSVHELQLMALAFNGDLLGRPVESVMSRPLEQIGIGEPVALAVTKLERSPALLVLDGGRPRAVVSSTDVLSYLSSISGDPLAEGVDQ